VIKGSHLSRIPNQYMPRYPKETTAALKRVLMCRRDNMYRFAEEDMPELMQKTGLSRTEIVHWALDVRTYYDSPEAMEKWFQRNGTVSNHKDLWETYTKHLHRVRPI